MWEIIIRMNPIDRLCIVCGMLAVFLKQKGIRTTHFNIYLFIASHIVIAIFTNFFA